MVREEGVGVVALDIVCRSEVRRKRIYCGVRRRKYYSRIFSFLCSDHSYTWRTCHAPDVNLAHKIGKLVQQLTKPRQVGVLRQKRTEVDGSLTQDRLKE